MLILKDLRKDFGDRVLFTNVSYSFPAQGILALVGVNGSGKTTLLNILCGLDSNYDGFITKPQNYEIGFLPQEPNPWPETNILQECMAGDPKLFSLHNQIMLLQKKLEENYDENAHEFLENLEKEFTDQGGKSFQYSSEQILLNLGFKKEQLIEHPDTLSGGWRMRLELARLLRKKTDFLILDEPTNHLDLPAIEWLETYLLGFKGTILFVSHDEQLLNNLPKTILHLKSQELNDYKGNYDSFLRQYEERQLNKISMQQNLSKKMAKVENFVERFGAKASKAKQAQSRLKTLAKMERQLNEIKIDDDDMEINIKVPISQKSGKIPWQIKEGALGYNTPLVRGLNFMIQRGQKIAVIGPNGLGKSTLLKSIYGLLPWLAGETKEGFNLKMAYYDQDQNESLIGEKNILENLLETNSGVTQLQARSLLGSFLFRGDDVFKKVAVLSGGEKSRLSLCCLLVKDANFLILDEPTNHLDMLSIGILANALIDYEGTVIFVSHNRSFINQVATHILQFENSRNVKFQSLEKN